jgi:non-ribosomal peptide synthetase-like protein
MERFIAHQLPSSSGERLYRTGDLVRLDKNLNLVYLGRIDTQVKHRGFRIELGEIEHAIAAHPRVQTAAVILSAGTDRVEAYVVAKDGEVIEIKELRDKLRLLPAYMQPEGFYFIPAKDMPRLPSGKINATALQDTSTYFAVSQKREHTDKQLVNAGNDIPNDSSDLSILLRAMAVIFPQAGNITPTSDFFDDLGGHSLVAAMLVSKLRKDCPEGSALKGLGLQVIYLCRTAEKIAASLGEVSDDNEAFYEKDKTVSAHLGDHWPVSQRKYVLCSLAQVPVLLFFFLIEGISILAPYLVFYAVLRAFTLGAAVLTTYCIFVVIPPLRVLVGIAGKWISLGKAKAGEYPLYSLYYYRFWVAERFVALVDMVTIADTPLLPAMMRCMGSHVGVHCHIGVTYVGAAFDLVFIGDDVTMGKDTVLATSWVERGRLILAPVSVGSQTHLGSNSLLEGSNIEEGGELGPMSMLPQGAHVPAGERWTGSPARFRAYSPDVGDMRASRPSEMRTAAVMTVMALSSVFILPIIQFAPQIPSMLLFEYTRVPHVGWWAQTAIVSAPAALIYTILVFVVLVVLRWLVLGTVVECSFRTTSVYFYRKWLVDRLMDMSLVILHPVYASLYVVPFLRSLGVKVGRGAEVSTARGINFELTEIGDESFIADRVLLGDQEVRRNMVTLKKTKLNRRAFLGNASLVPQGTELASNTLIGVLSCAPDIPLKEGQSCFGSPPLLMPSRQRGQENHPNHLLYTPRPRQIALRLFIEGMRIIVPRILITFGLGFGLQVFESAYQYIGLVPTLLLLPLFYFFCEFPMQVFLAIETKSDISVSQSLPFPPLPLLSFSSGSSSVATDVPNGLFGVSMCGSRNLSLPLMRHWPLRFSPTC